MFQGVELDWKRRNCFCDDACSVYGDCCVDARRFRAAEQREAHKRFGCLNLKQYGDVYIGDKCPDGWRGANRVREACHSQDEVCYSLTPPKTLFMLLLLPCFWETFVTPVSLLSRRPQAWTILKVFYHNGRVLFGPGFLGREICGYGSKVSN